MRPTGDAQLEAIMGDIGGFPGGSRCTAPTLDELFDAVEAKAADWRLETYEFQQELLSGLHGEIPHERELRVTGWPPVSNPHFDPTASKDA